MAELMTELWTTVTLPQALLLLAALYCLVALVRMAVDAVRCRLGKDPLGGWDHCEHCEVVDGLAEQLGRLCSIAEDQAGTTDEIRGAVAALRDVAETRAAG